MGYFAFPYSFTGKKIVRIKSLDSEKTVGLTGCGYSEFYRYPASYLIPEGDPQYDKEGNTANGLYGYLLNFRCWLYDVGLALLVFTVAGEQDIVEEMLHRLKEDQREDGSWVFSYDLYIGRLFQDYIRTGAVGWVLWGICYALLNLEFEEDDKADWLEMAEKAGDWLLSMQVTDEDDPRYGLLLGGHGSYDNDYNWTDEDIQWCSIEHQCSALQGLEGCALLLRGKRFRTGARLIRRKLMENAWLRDEGRFCQGVRVDETDEAWALDCTTWAGLTSLSAVSREFAQSCLETALDAFLVEGVSIVESSEENRYNQTYSSEETFSGFKPYSDNTDDYDGAPELVWSEGTLGFAALALALGQGDLAREYVDTCIALQQCEGGSGGVLYVTATYGEMPWEMHVWEASCSSAWLYLLVNAPEVLMPRCLLRPEAGHRMETE
ncbi:MAG: hypothetical protein LUD69_09075 [Oscillospiraceae bacterium]|nr:hypothetical protein [Oscillospiraceae bacterium]